MSLSSLPRTNRFPLFICGVLGACSAPPTSPPGQVVSTAQATSGVQLPPDLWNNFLAGRRNLAQDCPWPDKARYGKTKDAFTKGRLPIHSLPTEGGALDGCAVIRFSLDAQGKVTTAEIAEAHPDSIGAFAFTLIRAMTFTHPTGAADRYMIRFGLHRQATGQWSEFEDMRGNDT